MFQTLKSKLLVFFLLVTFIPLIVIGMMGYYTQKSELTSNLEDSLMAHTAGMSAEIEGFIRERIYDVEYLARNPVLMDADAANQEMRQQFNHFIQIHDLYFGVVMADPSGTVIADTNDETLGADVTDRSWFIRSMEGESYLSELYYSPVINENVIALSAPVYNYQNELTGVITPLFDLDELTGTMQNFNREQKAGDSDTYAFLVNGDGELISHPDTSKTHSVNYFQRFDTSREELDEIFTSQGLTTHGPEIHVLRQVEVMPGFENEWYVGVAADEAGFYAPLNRLLYQYLAVFGIVLLIVTFAVFRLSRYIVRPVEHLVEVTENVAFDSGKQPRYVQAYEEVNRLNYTFDNMTRKLQERERSHRKSSLVLEATGNGVIAMNRLTGQITLFNRRSEEVFGVSRDQVIGAKGCAVSRESEAFKAFIGAADLVTLLGKEEIHRNYEIECEIEDQPRTFYLSVTSLPKLNDPAVHEEMLVVFHDLTEKRQMENELIRSEKLKVVGEMAAGVAHEIRNPLTTVRGFIQLIDGRESESVDNRKYYNLIIKEIDRVNQICNDLMNIANPNSAKKAKHTNLELLLDDMLLLHQSQLRSRDIRVNTYFHGRLPQVFVDSGRIQQVFLNLVQNAAEAMSGGGRLTISTAYRKPDDMIVITFADTGEGMDEKTLEKLGTPFYSTKKTGTGLGLTTSYRIIEELGGQVLVTSEKGTGTTITVHIPVHSSENNEDENNEDNEKASES
ncbi:sensor histidine kinase [Alteribacter natronophilus]|uniref:sensor histidine kinase n=1 Tax=Alteribacter natronophilus TaxID=2583810 RepID=UPI00110D3F6E|nr:PAS domain-containing sensor histidine kinase [Alteribacter natronophilus]TMW72103.1 HAMP domain-containing protein [Alteribacter natronophilus]